MVVSQRYQTSIALVLALILPLSGCNGAAVQRAFSADPNASRWGNAQGQLPADFPAELRYPNAELQAAGANQRQATQDPPANGGIQRTRWVTTVPGQTVQTFYRRIFQRSEWQLLGQQSNQDQTVLRARKQTLQVTVTIPNGLTTVMPPSNRDGANRALPPSNFNVPLTAFTVEYYRDRPTAAQRSLNSPQGSRQPNDPNFIGPVAPVAGTGEPEQPSNSLRRTAVTLTDLEQAPSDLQPYLKDLAQLGVFTPDIARDDAKANALFQPSQTMKRGTFAYWLVETNNRLYRDRPTRQIRLASASAKPVFQDVPSSDPTFPYIQGLAEAGYIPSSLSGDKNQRLFRPNDALTRETLLLWKVPIDLRQILPTTTATKVQQVWGFKDANRITPNALAAVLADHRNGDLSNIRRLLGSALLFQPQKAVTRAEAAATLWFIGIEGEGFSANDILRAQRQSAAIPRSTPTN